LTDWPARRRGSTDVHLSRWGRKKTKRAKKDLKQKQTAYCHAGHSPKGKRCRRIKKNWTAAPDNSRLFTITSLGETTQCWGRDTKAGARKTKTAQPNPALRVEEAANSDTHRGLRQKGKRKKGLSRSPLPSQFAKHGWSHVMGKKEKRGGVKKTNWVTVKHKKRRRERKDKEQKRRGKKQSTASGFFECRFEVGEHQNTTR